MSISATIAGIALGALAMYGVGLPIAWLLPAPSHAQWIHRIATAPLLSIVVASMGARLMGALGIPLAPWQLVVLAGALWVGAWVRTGETWAITSSVKRAAQPAVVVAVGALAWTLSLIGHGLYLPNRDFKNHAYVVAQVAWTRSSDFSMLWRSSPVSDPVELDGFYPVGLHILLGWVLPTADGNTLAVTAAAAVLAAAISLPLALICLARSWSPQSPLLAWAAGLTAVALPSLSSPFGIGSVVLIVGTALYAAALGSVWLWYHSPGVGTTIGLAMVGLGLFFLHVAEAVGLALVALLLLPGLLRRIRGRVSLGSRWILLAVAFLAVGVGVAIEMGTRLAPILTSGFEWDIQPNDQSIPAALAMALVQQPGGTPIVALFWVTLGLLGFWIAAKQNMSSFPLVAFAVPVVLAFLSGVAGLPSIVALLTSPWYGSASRAGLLAAAPLVLSACWALVAAIEKGSDRSARLIAGGVAMACIVGLAVQVVPARRADLRASLAGAGDTIAVAQGLASRLEPGQTVLNLEGDGTANLFAYARVPVLSGLALEANLTDDPLLAEPITDHLLNLGDPLVARRLSQLNVAFIVLGVTSRYWNPEVGYIWQDVAAQPAAELDSVGTDVVVLRYLEGGQP